MAKRNKRPDAKARAAAKVPPHAGQAGKPAGPKGRGKTSADGKKRANGGVFAGLKPNAANFAPLTPISFLPRTAAIHPDRVAVVHGDMADHLPANCRSG